MEAIKIEKNLDKKQLLNSQELILKKLISFDTTSSKSNLELINYICDYLDIFKIETSKVYNEDKSKASIYYTIGNKKLPGLVLSAHTDTVPVDIDQWSYNPYELNIQKDKYYGRGTTDMKGFISIVLALTPWVISKSFDRPIHVALSYDEEVGCLGVGPLINSMTNNVCKPKLVVVGEPTDLKIVNQHKSCHTFETEFHGKKAHSCYPDWGCNAIYFASEFINELRKIEQSLIHGDKDVNFEPPHSSINVGRIEGGTAHNIVPDYARVVWNIRCLPSESFQVLLYDLFNSVMPSIESKMKKKYRNAYISNRNISNILPLNQKNFPEILISLTKTDPKHKSGVSYGTDAGYFSDVGWPTIVCGPGKIEQAHTSDEFIKINDIKDGIDFMMSLMSGILS